MYGEHFNFFWFPVTLMLATQAFPETVFPEPVATWALLGDGFLAYDPDDFPRNCSPPRNGPRHSQALLVRPVNVTLIKVFDMVFSVLFLFE